MHRKLKLHHLVAAGLAVALLLAAVPAQAAPAPASERVNTAAAWLRGVLQQWVANISATVGTDEGPGIDPDGAQAPIVPVSGGESDAGPGIDPNG